MLPAHWIEHRRGDRELLGWIAPEGEGFVAHDLLGRPLHEAPVDWLEAEEALDELGIGYLADRYRLVLPDGSDGPVRIAEVDAERIVLLGDEYGAASAVGGAVDRHELPFPPGAALRPW